MSSSYALPSTTVTHAHNGHMHSHARSQSQSSLNSWKSSISNGRLHAYPEHEEDPLNHNHAHDHHQHDLNRTNYTHNRNHSLTSNASGGTSRSKPSLSYLDTGGPGHTLGVQAPGFAVEPPTPEGFINEKATDDYVHNHRHSHGHLHEHFSPPTAHAHNHSHGHDHKDSHDHCHGHSHSHSRGHGHDHKHDDHDHHHDHFHPHDHSHDHAANAPKSLFTRTLLPYTAPYPIIHAIMTEKDSRRIFYFMIINFGFMGIQAFYGYVTDSLGLLSDSIHMFFDCVALLVGLLAAVLSKWPPSQKFPNGFGKIETLSGFANGILLMLLSVEIAFEAFERLYEGTETKRLGELFIVSSMGLAVNLVGLTAFGHHHHHGHDHGHSHGHGHGHDHHGHDHHGHGHGHDHLHDNENMYGIYLHIMADTLGSVSVIVSTALTSFYGWAGWDPLASCFIAILIFLSAQPLVFSSGKRLLLNVPESTEYNLRNILDQIPQQRGVANYSVPKFWMDDRGGADSGDKMVGIVHVMAARGAGLEEVRDRVRELLLKHGIDVVVQVERDGDMSCWCSRWRGPLASPASPMPQRQTFQSL